MFRIEADFRRFERGLSDVAQKQLPFALSVALNETAKDVLDAIRDQTRLAFDRPTPFTLNAFYLSRATKRKPEASVQRKTAQSKRHFLEVQEEGGRRGQTGIEGLLEARAGLTGRHRFIVPASGAKLNSYGNPGRGQINRILSQLHAQRDTTANETGRSRRRSRHTDRYFVITGDDFDSKLAPGIWLRRGGRVEPVFLFARRPPRYAPKLDFYATSNAVTEARFERHLAEAMAKAIATAR
ncbi:hypothetical protein FDP22_16620 [Paroceanicella profunda]|uniref:Uncharacterized protein n=1 Tax=Paroceanicella profunda TaxID=2579971 RepID=A0A5B8G3E5_9RHOB|nr:hypothetical protein [Paroceanicella profunda]QDL93263.1 hypothetical protein FDP22_16620 [Paroceanicella profunda]